MRSDVFTYGSLQFPAVMHAVTGRRFPCETAVLADYERHRLRGRSYPGLRRRTGARTEGALYRGVDRLALQRLDRFEDFFYRRQRLPVTIAPARTSLAEVYVVPPRYCRLLAPRPWSLQQFRRRALNAYLRACRSRSTVRKMSGRSEFPRYGQAGDGRCKRKGG